MKTLTLILLIISCFSLNAYAQRDTLWTRRSSTFIANALVADESGGVVVLGTLSGNMNVQYYNALGEVTWSRAFSGIITSSDLRRTEDGGYIVMGCHHNSLCLAKLNASGDVQWQKDYSQIYPTLPCGKNISPSTGGDYLVSCWDLTVIRFSAGGDTVWTRVMSETAYDSICAALPDRQEEISVVGSKTNYNDNTNRIVITKLGAHGDSLWTRPYSLSCWINDAQVNANDILAAGRFIGDYGRVNCFMFRSDLNGTLEWTHHNSYMYSEGLSIEPTHDGGVIAAGYVYPYDAFGRFILVVKQGGIASWIWNTQNWWQDADIIAIDIVQTSDDGYVVLANSVNANSHLQETVLIRLASYEPVENPFILAPSSFDLSAFPNPFNPNTTLSFTLPQTEEVRLTVYDILGSEVKILQDGIAEAGEHQFSFDGSSLPSGIYFARLESKGMVKTQKLLLLK